MKLFLELVGYTGTALVVLSMLMTSVVRLRILNILGSVFSLLYALAGQAYPIVLMNAVLILINLYHLLRIRRTALSFRYVRAAAEDASLLYFTSLYAEDIAHYFPTNSAASSPKEEAHLAFCGAELAGIILGERQGDTFVIRIDYASPRYRDLTMSSFLYGHLRESGIRTLYATESRDYFRKAGFHGDTRLTKSL